MVPGLQSSLVEQIDRHRTPVASQM